MCTITSSRIQTSATPSSMFLLKFSSSIPNVASQGLRYADVPDYDLIERSITNIVDDVSCITDGIVAYGVHCICITKSLFVVFAACGIEGSG